MKYKIEIYSDLDSLEFGLLEELPKLRVLNSLITDDEREKRGTSFWEIREKLGEVTQVGRIFEVVCERNNGFICMDGENFSDLILIQNYPKMEVGEIYLSHKTPYEDENSVIKINEEFTDKKKTAGIFIEMDEWVSERDTDSWGRNGREYTKELIQAEGIEGGEITFEIIKEKFKEHKLEVEKREKEEKEEKEKVEEEKVEKECDEEAEYKSKGCIKFNHVSVVNKMIKMGGEEYVLDKNINKVISYEEVKNINYHPYPNTILSAVETCLNDKRLSYVKKKKGEELYKVVYTGDKCKINEVNIPSAKIKFILNRIYFKGKEEEEIKILVKLNGMKSDFVSLEEIEWMGKGRLKIPISSNAIDEKTFEVEFLGKKRTFDWEEVKDKFYNGGGSRSINSWFHNEELLKLAEDIGATKKELFSALKRIKMLNSLENKDDN